MNTSTFPWVFAWILAGGVQSWHGEDWSRELPERNTSTASAQALPRAAVGRCLGRGGKETPVTSLGKLFFLASRKFTCICKKTMFRDSAELAALYQKRRTTGILKKGIFSVNWNGQNVSVFSLKTMLPCWIEFFKIAKAKNNLKAKKSKELNLHVLWGELKYSQSSLLLTCLGWKL